MKPNILIIVFISSILFFCVGVFLGDLAGIGGYDGIAPRFLYEKLNLQPGNERLFHMAETGSIALLWIGIILFLIFLVGLIIFLIQKVKAHK
ncbi:hypothetical protein O5O45_25290 [Hahella aquimaris]|uniref:hypothetical protein n=1 Tax=Hahella sp. HNIBRBA332 TaxID=3015983 RepID=UPI00273C811B|nr:hypothetical protein [Hahella sp. HNIBRBA332]WLQ13047.1 hypothetical protein O5O45_25290 [Hahella sp. HNIBRBA332]